MTPRLTPGESAVLYGVVIGFVFLFYLLGLSLGNSKATEPGVEGIRSGGDSVPREDLKSDLEFYQQLVEPEASKDLVSDESTESDEPVEPAAVDQVADVIQGPAEESVIQPIQSLYTVQVGAFKSATDARQLRLRLEGKGYSSILREPSQTESFYRVWVGDFSTEEAAKEMERELRQDGFLTYIKALPPSSSVH